MKALDLNDEHKSKLLEMCKKLFPEYTFITFQESAIMGAGWEYDFNNICFSKKSDSLFDIEINIHWFEFCMTHLSKRLYTIDNKIMSGYLNFFHNFNYTKKHPVDYLYEKFKKIEQ